MDREANSRATRVRVLNATTDQNVLAGYRLQRQRRIAPQHQEQTRGTSISDTAHSRAFYALINNAERRFP